MKRVCIVRHACYPDDTHVRRNAETLAKHGFNIDIICLKKKTQPSEEVIGGVKVHRLPLEHHRRGLVRYVFEYLAFFLLVSWKLIGFSLRRRFDTIEIDNMPNFLVFSALIPKLLGSRIVLYMFDNMPETFADSRKTSLNHIGVRLLRLEEKLSVLLADHVIVCQETCKKMLRSRGTAESKISVVLNVPDEDVFNQNIPSSKDNGVFRLITHGTLVERYNVQSLIRTIPLLIHDIPELEVNVVGDGEYRPQLEELARTLGVKDYINFTGMVPFSEVSKHIARADVGIVVIPAGANPALPHKLFEYMALGKPVVVTTIPAITAYFDDSSMLFYKPDNSPDMARCILELYHNPAKRAAIAAAVVAVYQQYHWPAMKNEYIKVFERLCDHSPKGAD